MNRFAQRPLGDDGANFKTLPAVVRAKLARHGLDRSNLLSGQIAFLPG
ncbi:hypothetical protein [Burkholderia sp. MSMB1835]|nr:hypothetical protein [Burkholderia sp. MSMB1835]